MTSRCSTVVLALFGAFLLAHSAPLAAQESQDNNPHIQPRDLLSAPSAKPQQPQPTPSPEQGPPRNAPTGQAPANSNDQGESSSKDSQGDFSGGSRPALPPPSSDAPDEKTFRPWDPHRAAKDIEVGEYYLKLKNYRAALERFNDALLYKPNDAEATFDLAVTQERLDLFAKASHNYSRYLEILPSGPRAKESQEALKRLESRIAAPAADDAEKRAAESIDAGETYLARNNYDAARERFEEALRLMPENPKACFRMAQSLQGLQRPETARLYYQKYLDLDPHGTYAGDARKAIAEINYYVGK
jgi:tetratricopeptide (TPR) repeat protein